MTGPEPGDLAEIRFVVFGKEYVTPAVYLGPDGTTGQLHAWRCLKPFGLGREYEIALGGDEHRTGRPLSVVPTDSLQTRIEAAIEAHPVEVSNGSQTACGRCLKWFSNAEYRTHVAAAVRSAITTTKEA